MSEKRIIKKYPNRRLYDTNLGTYITLDDVKQLVIDHVEFEVIDARTKKDLTQTILLQIIAEQEATNDPLFTKDVLQNFIRSYHEKSQTMFSEYLQEMMKVFTQQKDFYNNQWQTYQKLMLNPDVMQEALKMQKMWMPNTETKKKSK